MARSLPIACVKDCTSQAKALAVLRKMPEGCTSRRMHEMMGGGAENWSEAMRRLVEHGVACWVPDPQGKAAQQKRFFAVEFAENAAEFKRQRDAKVRPKKPKAFVLRLDPDAPVVQLKAVRVTVGPTFDPGARFRPAAGEMAPLFSCLAPGRYLDRDTWAARAYGGRS